MKIPFSFSIKLVFRLLLPGFIVSVSLLPILNTIINNVGLTDQMLFAFTLSIIIIGWLFIVLDMQIYMLFEGRRYWPDFLKKFCINCEKKRLKKLHDEINIYLAERDKKNNAQNQNINKNDTKNLISEKKYRENSIRIRRFPMNDDGDYVVKFPTRLGNLLCAYEEYPKRIYGMSSLFYWPRLWLILDDKLREEIDNQQAIADSTVYSATALMVSGIISFFYLALKYFNISLLDSIPNYYVIVYTAAYAPILGFLLFRNSFEIHWRFGDLFKSVFDIYSSKIEFEKILAEISSISNLKLEELSLKQKNQIVWRYLNNFRIKKDNRIYKPIDLNKNKEK